MELKTKDTSTAITLNDAIFTREYNEGLIHQLVVTCLNNIRSGTSAQKTRAEVRGGGRKPWKQKGTGRARAGSIRSPIWRGGGVTFASKQRDYTVKINKKMVKAAMQSIYSELLRRGDLVVVSSFDLETRKTKDFISKMQSLQITNALIVLDEVTENAYYGSRNLADYDICDAYSVDAVSLLKYNTVVITEAALKEIEEQLQ